MPKISMRNFTLIKTKVTLTLHIIMWFIEIKIQDQDQGAECLDEKQLLVRVFMSSNTFFKLLVQLLKH